MTPTVTSGRYVEIPAARVPADLIWVTPRRYQGQIVEVSYSTGVPSGRDVNYDAAHGDPYRRVVDHGDSSVWYYRWEVPPSC